MKRRSFVKSVPLASGGVFSLNHLPVKVMGKDSQLFQLTQFSEDDEDRVMVIIQLHGGNDGLNTVIPIEQYDLYYQKRANIAIPAKNSARRYIPLDSTLAPEDQVGLHPDMYAAKDLYDSGRMSIVQGVSYPHNNGSHFRGQDIWLMGGGYARYTDSGWIGRYLASKYNVDGMQYPDDYPNAEMKDPLAIEIGSDVSLMFHQQGNIPTSISLPGSPEGFKQLVESLAGFEDTNIDPRGMPPAFLKDSPYYKEMEWILGLEDKTEDYAARLLEVFNSVGATKVTYPEAYTFAAPKAYKYNSLSSQLQLVARLVAGGAKTKAYLVKIGGFDTHADQVEIGDPTMGLHAALMYHVTSAMRAFQEDLRVRGVEDRVLSMTISEFGRRIESNGSYGTDHGKGGPMFLFGKHVKPGVVGTNHDLKSDDGNIAMQFDYRQVYAGVLMDWMKVDKDIVSNVLFDNFIDGEKVEGEEGMYTPLNLIKEKLTTGNEDFFNSRYRLNDPYPNPAKNSTKVSYYINAELNVSLTMLDSRGQLVKTLVSKTQQAGEHSMEVDLSGIKSGVYILQINAGLLKTSKKLIVK